MTTTGWPDAHGLMAEADVEQFLGELDESVQAALGPARSLLDDSPARPIALELEQTFKDSAALYREAVARRTEIESDQATKPEVLRQQWADYRTDFEERRESTYRRLKALEPELRAALTEEALPVIKDATATLVARQEVEAALRVANGSKINAMVKLAARGGDVSAALVSEWGRLVFAAHDEGGDIGFDAIRAEAIKTSLNSSDEGPRRAATVLQASDSPRPGGRVKSLYESEVLAVQALNWAKGVVEKGPILS